MKAASVGWLALLLLGCGGGGQAGGEGSSQARENGEATGDSAPQELASETASQSPDGRDSAALAADDSLAITVIWPDAPAALRGSPGRDPCGQRRPAPLSVHTLGGVRNALVWLEPEAEAEPPAPDADVNDPVPDPIPAISVADCRMQPKVMLLPRQAEVLLVHSDSEARQRVRVQLQSRDGGKASGSGSELDFWLPLVGSQVAVPMSEPGLWRIASESDPKTASYVLSRRGIHAARTDDRGVARLDGVPAGSYTLTVWHPPVRAGQPAIRRSMAIDTKKAREITLSLASK